MKTCIKLLFYLYISLFFFSSDFYSQNKLSSLTKLPFQRTLSVDSGVLCIGGEIHDDGSYETGYGWNNEVYDGRWTIKFLPQFYPWYYTKICLTLSRLEAGPDTFQFKLVAFDTLGPGCPGSRVWFKDTMVFNIGIWPSTSTYQFTGLTIPPIFKGYYWIGIQYDPSIAVNNQKYICSDLLSLSGTWPGECYNYYQGSGSWAAIETYDPNYSCLGIRTEGSRVQPGESDCEGFISFTFPPPYWSLDPYGTNGWSRAFVSGYGYGSGSAYCNMYSIPDGSEMSLISRIFEPTGTHDTLSFDIAYCKFYSFQDSLIILTSTNWGNSFNSLVRMGPDQMSTTDGMCLSPFTPDWYQWGTRTYILPQKTNKVQFLAKSRMGNNLYLDNICINRDLVGQRNPAGNLPKNYKLFQNYPNPFNPSTKIKFDIPLSRGVLAGRGVLVRLVIYDVLGREVATLVNEQLKPGTYEYEWPAPSGDGSYFAGGIYFYKLETSDFVQTKKMILIK